MINWQKAPTIRCTLRSSDLLALEVLATEQWTQFLAQDGEINRATHNEFPSSYSLLSGLWIEAGNRIVIGSYSITVEPQVELFRLYASVDNNCCEPRKEFGFRPRCAPLSKVPRDLDLSPFLNSHKRLSILRIAEEVVLGSDAKGEESFLAVVDSALLVTSSCGKRCMLYQDPDGPESLAITTSANTIDHIITNSYEIVLI